MIAVQSDIQLLTADAWIQENSELYAEWLQQGKQPILEVSETKILDNS